VGGKMRKFSKNIKSFFRIDIFAFKLMKRENEQVFRIMKLYEWGINKPEVVIAKRLLINYST
jgi:hypothetical protein